MASFGLGLLVLLLTTHPEPSKAQHCSHSWHPEGKQASSSLHDPQHTPGPPAHSPGQIVPNLPSYVLAPPEDSVPWESRTMARWLLHRKQHLVQTLLYGPDNQVVIDTCTGNDSVIAELPKANSGSQV
ncbi:progonadoliberin-2 [Lagenorhynchus albirostris]|uniref:progonadoliberin-2 n=1 Tax=Lagenorhynchus albirostris TaxID=27610 RepID=UPI0028E89818|nr:progonadoliberin-2 [Lagenorhynchus albirostris]